MKALENIKEIYKNAIMIVSTLESEKDSVIIPIPKSKFDRLINEAITELEALESRSCDGCKHYLSQDGKYPVDPCSECSRFYGDMFERREDENKIL